MTLSFDVGDWEPPPSGVTFGGGVTVIPITATTGGLEVEVEVVSVVGFLVVVVVVVGGAVVVVVVVVVVIVVVVVVVVVVV